MLVAICVMLVNVLCTVLVIAALLSLDPLRDRVAVLEVMAKNNQQAVKVIQAGKCPEEEKSERSGL